MKPPRRDVVLPQNADVHDVPVSCSESTLMVW